MNAVAMSGCVNHLQLYLPKGIKEAKQIHGLTFHWKSEDGEKFSDFSLHFMGDMERILHSFPLAGPVMTFDSLPKLHEDEECWKAFRNEMCASHSSLTQGYANVAFRALMHHATLKLILMPANRTAWIQVEHAPKVGPNIIWEARVKVSDILHCFTFDADSIDWSAAEHSILQTDLSAAA